METETPAPTPTPEPAPPAPVPEPNGNGATPVAETSPAEKQTVEEMFRFAEYVHVGPGAEDCEDRESGACGNPLHFHAWCRLPNPFQNESIRQKALAAKARKMRQLRDPGTDGFEILEAEMDQLRRIGEQSGKEALVEDILNQTYWKDHLTAVREVGEQEEFATIREDTERFRALSALKEEDRPADEWEELQRHMEKYDEAVTAKRKEEQTPQRTALEGLDVDQLIAQIRDARIETEGNEDFMRVFNQWQIYVGTLKPRPAEKGLPNERVFGDINHLTDSAAPEVVNALQRTFQEMEMALGARGAVGNS